MSEKKSVNNDWKLGQNDVLLVRSVTDRDEREYYMVLTKGMEDVDQILKYQFRTSNRNYKYIEVLNSFEYIQVTNEFYDRFIDTTYVAEKSTGCYGIDRHLCDTGKLRFKKELGDLAIPEFLKLFLYTKKSYIVDKEYYVRNWCGIKILTKDWEIG